MKLIRNSPPEERRPRGARAVQLARLAFEYDPINAHAWSLLRDALAAAGRLADAELVGWESIRRFPEDEQWRNQLATLLAGPLARPDEAARLLREAIATFPFGPYARNQLATILAGPLARPDEAARLLREAIATFPSDPYARSQLATVLADDLGDRDQARAVLERASADGAANEVTASLLGKLMQGRPLRRQGSQTLPEPGSDESSMRLPTAEARRALFRFEAGLFDRDALRRFLADAPADSYLTYVGERAEITNLPVKTTFAFAFDQALREASPSALRGLVARARPLERHLIEQAIALGEGRVVEFPSGIDAAGSGRLGKLDDALRASGGASADARTALLRDFSASTLSISSAIFAAA